MKMKVSVGFKHNNTSFNVGQLVDKKDIDAKAFDLFVSKGWLVSEKEITTADKAKQAAEEKAKKAAEEAIEKSGFDPKLFEEQVATAVEFMGKFEAMMAAFDEKIKQLSVVSEDTSKESGEDKGSETTDDSKAKGSKK